MGVEVLQGHVAAAARRAHVAGPGMPAAGNDAVRGVVDIRRIDATDHDGCAGPAAVGPRGVAPARRRRADTLLDGLVRHVVARDPVGDCRLDAAEAGRGDAVVADAVALGMVAIVGAVHVQHGYRPCGAAGVEPSAGAGLLRYAAARAASLGIHNVRWVQADIERIPEHFGGADLAYTAIVLHETSHAALRNVFRGCREQEFADAISAVPWITDARTPGRSEDHGRTGICERSGDRSQPGSDFSVLVFVDAVESEGLTE